MSWFKVDDTLHSHPKVGMASNRAMGLWVKAGSWCANHDTGGHVPRILLRVLGARRCDADELVRVGLWVATGDGYQFHQWASHQRSDYRPRIPVEVGRAVIERDWPNCQICHGSVALGDVQLDHIVPYSHGGAETVENLRLAHDVCNARRGAPAK